MKPNPDQLGFGALLRDTEEANEKRIRDREAGHLPGEMNKAIALFRKLLQAYHRAVMAGDRNEIERIDEEADRLAYKVEGSCAILANDNSAGNVFKRRTRARKGTVPTWGQAGEFEVNVNGVRVAIEWDGLFGIGSPGFAAHVVEPDKPFISHTGFRSFLGGSYRFATMGGGQTVDQFVIAEIEQHIATNLKGKLVAVAKEYRK